MKRLQKGLLAGAVTLALGALSPAYGASSIVFDQLGTAGAAGQLINTFDWAPDNALAIGALSTAPVGGVSTFEVVAQGKLGNFIAPGNTQIGVQSGEFTFQVRFFENATGIGGAAAAFTLGPGASTFTIYRDDVADSNQITGTGYGDGTAILTGTLVSLQGLFNNNTFTFPDLFPITLLDQLNADNQNGTQTIQGSGSTTIQINVNFADPNYFISNVTSLTVDMQDTSNNVVPFLQADPSDQIFGVTPFYTLNNAGQRVNGDGSVQCANGGQDENGNNSARCDIHLQTDASSSFNPTVPEPGTLALLGLALGAFSLGRRRMTRAS